MPLLIFLFVVMGHPQLLVADPMEMYTETTSEYTDGDEPKSYVKTQGWYESYSKCLYGCEPMNRGDRFEENGSCYYWNLPDSPRNVDKPCQHIRDQLKDMKNAVEVRKIDCNITSGSANLSGSIPCPKGWVTFCGAKWLYGKGDCD